MAYFMLLLQYLLWKKSNWFPQNHLKNTATDCTGQQCCVLSNSITKTSNGRNWYQESGTQMRSNYCMSGKGLEGKDGMDSAAMVIPMELVNCNDHSKPDWNFIMYVIMKLTKRSALFHVSWPSATLILKPSICTWPGKWGRTVSHLM